MTSWLSHSFHIFVLIRTVFSTYLKIKGTFHIQIFSTLILAFISSFKVNFGLERRNREVWSMGSSKKYRLCFSAENNNNNKEKCFLYILLTLEDVWKIFLHWWFCYNCLFFVLILFFRALNLNCQREKISWILVSWFAFSKQMLPKHQG